MRRKTIAAGAVAAVIAGGALALPAMAADNGPSPTKTSSAPVTGLTDAQQQELDDFLAAHPKAAQALVTRLEGWQKFADAHPAVVTELKKVAAMSPEQRRTELKAWAKAHPADAKAFREFRKQIRDARKDRRERRKDAKPGSSGSSSATSPSSSRTT
ncbi:hemophore-related protein [Angustibacter sp. McL0619]|uniref:hemophore-related protein n=1 Tax=Angustibacter sp. McL0619 TaxID=3415676 RepID=UPI003CED2341